jgi:hypothetical protein
MPPKYREVIYLYGEPNLQKTVKIDDEVQVSSATESGMEELSARLGDIPGLGRIEIDPDCTDIYPSTHLFPLHKNIP